MIKTIKLKDEKTGEEKDYATVPARSKKFWEDNPNGSVETESKLMPDGNYAFKATIVTDRTTDGCKKATGHALGKVDGDKSYEKLETVAIGRALSNIGYQADGKIAGIEEMEIYKEKVEKKKRSEVATAISSLKRCKTVDTLKNKFMSLGNLMNNVEVMKVKDDCYTKLTTIN